MNKEKILFVLNRMSLGDIHEEKMVSLINEDVKKYPDADIKCIIEQCIPQSPQQEDFKQKILFALRFQKYLKQF